MLDRPIQAAAEGLPKNRISSTDLLVVDDRLGDIACLIDAMFLAAGSIEEPRHCNALQALSMQANKDIASLRDRIEDLRELLK
ncbi:hypothetical protein [Sinorhizobium fredii]|uniref:Uncharacterized protein n=1 Tax=Sinorhizobium fredii (strain HH103) TaxID=1117943 RepID=G9A1I6_SINF1|nr:hypothetical protein [Sinorhizobium fredii]ASY69726.1 hypothetical protein SF83666_c23100 [Sinorhizobium fredii CCBAU 83666]CCE97566.1 hypothetical protein SFHH103_03074 [Sinorhizobium fredii HH103]